MDEIIHSILENYAHLAKGQARVLNNALAKLDRHNIHYDGQKAHDVMRAYSTIAEKGLRLAKTA